MRHFFKQKEPIQFKKEKLILSKTLLCTCLNEQLPTLVTEV